MYKHISVMLNECIEALNIKPNGVYMDGTLGGGGHSYEIAKRLKAGKLIVFDKDSAAIKAGRERLKEFKNVTFVKSDFMDFAEELNELSIEKLDGVLLDLGLSSHQIDERERGFSYMQEARLDMRMDREQELSAYEVVNEYSEAELIKIFFEYGEEGFAKKIASEIVKVRKQNPIETTLQLSEICEKIVPHAVRAKLGHPAKRVFQALRIEVNDELSRLEQTVVSLARRLRKGGRIAVITFHSLEDRLVKNAFKMLSSDCLCDKSLPLCVCGHEKEISLITKKPILAGNEELKTNQRAKSAKLRVAEKL